MTTSQHEVHSLAGHAMNARWPGGCGAALSCADLGSDGKWSFALHLYMRGPGGEWMHQDLLAPELDKEVGFLTALHNSMLHFCRGLVLADRDWQEKTNAL